MDEQDLYKAKEATKEAMQSAMKKGPLRSVLIIATILMALFHLCFHQFYKVPFSLLQIVHFLSFLTVFVLIYARVCS